LPGVQTSTNFKYSLSAKDAKRIHAENAKKCNLNQRFLRLPGGMVCQEHLDSGHPFSNTSSLFIAGWDGKIVALWIVINESRQSKKPYGVLQIGGYDLPFVVFKRRKINCYGIGGYSAP
jgi:hypothetical protein